MKLLRLLCQSLRRLLLPVKHLQARGRKSKESKSHLKNLKNLEILRLRNAENIKLLILETARDCATPMKKNGVSVDLNNAPSSKKKWLSAPNSSRCVFLSL